MLYNQLNDLGVNYRSYFFVNSSQGVDLRLNHTLLTLLHVNPELDGLLEHGTE